MKIMKWILIILVSVVAVTGLGGYLYLKSTLPKYDGKVALQGISEPVEVVRDSCGVPHIFGQNQEDAYFALGYCMAQDRLFQMELIRLASQGRLSELFGKATVDADKLFRTVYCAYDWDKIMKSRSPLAAPVEDAFIRGINAYIEQGGTLPFQFSLMGYRPAPYRYVDIASLLPFYVWTTTDPLRPELLKAAVIKKVGTEMGQELFVEDKRCPTTIPRGEPCYPGFKDFGEKPIEEKSASLDRATSKAVLQLLSMVGNVGRTLDSLGFEQVRSACNSFVISPEKTGTGKPLLAQDFHFPYVIPSYLYEAAVCTPNNKVGGYVFVGLPYVLGGQNEHMAWVFTAGCGDQADVYIEKLHPDDPNKYLFRDTYEEMKIKRETIKVKGAKNVELTVRLTRHGPVMDDLIEPSLKPGPSGTSLSIRLASVDFFGESEALRRMNTAKNADEFLDAAGSYKNPDEHWIYADDNGEIGYFYGGAIPVREGFDGSLPLPGWTGEFEWQGYVPAEMQPQLRNPKMGFINTSNTKPAPSYYPYPQGETYAQPDRLARVREIISQTIAQNGKFTAGDANKVFTDCEILRAQEWVPLLLDAAKGKQLGQKEKMALDKLAHWDYVSCRESVPAMIFQATLTKMVENTLARRLGDQLFNEFAGDRDPVKSLRNLMNREESQWFADPQTSGVGRRADFLLQSFKEAVRSLETKLGPDVDRWQLSRLLTLTLRSPLSKAIPALAPVLDVGPLRVSGGIIAPFNTTYKFSKPFEVTNGTQARFVVDFSNRRNCKIVNMPGISENFMSPHYKDQVQMWSDFQFRPLAIYREEADKDAKYLLKLLPK